MQRSNGIRHRLRYDGEWQVLDLASEIFGKHLHALVLALHAAIALYLFQAGMNLQ